MLRLIKIPISISERESFVTGNGKVFTDPIRYESGFCIIAQGHVSEIEKGLPVVQHGFCWSSSNSDPGDASLGLDKNGNPMGRWFRVTDLPKVAQGGLGFSIGPKAYIGLGVDSLGNKQQRFWELDPLKNRLEWRKIIWLNSLLC